MVERMAEAAERDDNPYSGMSEEDYAALCAAEEAEAEAREFEFKRDGMVAFFDVLGYSQLAAKASEGVVRDVMNALSQAHAEAKQLLDEIDLQEESRSVLLGSDFEDVRSVNISDSLIVHDRFPGTIVAGDEEGEFKGLGDSYRFYRFIRFCRKVWCVLFERGLPLRGAISIGTFYWDHKTMLAGEPVIEAYKASESLSFSGLILAEDSLPSIAERAWLLYKPEFPVGLDFLQRRLLVPVKTSSGDGLAQRDVILPDLSAMAGDNLAAYVKSRFEMHEKSVDSPRARAILRNTIDILSIARSEKTGRA